MENNHRLKLAGFFFLCLAAFISAIASIFITFLSNYAYEAFTNAQHVELLGSIALLTLAYILVFVDVGFLLSLSIYLAFFEEEDF